MTMNWGMFKFKRTHRFLIEVWEALFRSMLGSFTAHSNTNNLEEIIVNTLCGLANTDYDELATYSIIRSFE